MDEITRKAVINIVKQLNLIHTQIYRYFCSI